MYAGDYGYGQDRINSNWHQAAAEAVRSSGITEGLAVFCCPAAEWKYKQEERTVIYGI